MAPIIKKETAPVAPHAELRHNSHVTLADIPESLQLQQSDFQKALIPLVSIIAPVHNEDSTLQDLHDRITTTVGSLPQYRFEMIYVDDGSTDDSLKILRNLQKQDARVRIVELRRNFGQTPSLSAGLDHAKGDILITMDADLQHFPEEMPLFLDGIETGSDLVCGWRKDRQEGLLRRLPSWAANRMIRRISGLNIHDFGTTYRAYRREILPDLPLFGELHRFVPALAHSAGWRIREIPIQNIVRPKGKSNYGISRTFGVFLDLCFLVFYLRYLTRPLRAFGQLTALFFIPGFLISAILLGLSLLGAVNTDNHSGLLLLSVTLMIMGVQFLGMGVLSEMINRSYFASTNRLIYQVRHIWERPEDD